MKPTVTLSLEEYFELLEKRKELNQVKNGSVLTVKFFDYNIFYDDFSKEEIYISKDSVNDEILKNNTTLSDQISFLIDELKKIKKMSCLQFYKYKKSFNK